MRILDSPDYASYAKQTGHAADCAWTQWVVDGKFYPNPGCTCCRNVLPPKPRRFDFFRRLWHRLFSAFLLLIFLPLFGCVNLKEVDRRTGKPFTALHVSANVSHLEFTSANGSHLVMDNFDPAATHMAVGNMVSKGILSAGTAIATSGLGKVAK